MTTKRPHANWTTVEQKVLRLLFPDAPKARLVRELPRHSAKAIFSRAKQMGLKRNATGQRDWAAIAKAHKPVFSFSTSRA